jgi:hypothetical protein
MVLIFPQAHRLISISYSFRTSHMSDLDSDLDPWVPNAIFFRKPSPPKTPDNACCSSQPQDAFEALFFHSIICPLSGGWYTTFIQLFFQSYDILQAFCILD